MTRLALAGAHHRETLEHLFPGDGLEAAAVLLCARISQRSNDLIVREVRPVPYELCRRQRDSVSWPSDFLDGSISHANREGMSVILAHSHPEGCWGFSVFDDESDQEIVPDLYDELEDRSALVGTAIFLKTGAARARLYDRDCIPSDVDMVRIAGDDISFFFPHRPRIRPMAFGSGMRAELGALSGAVVGASGTGSIVAEQMARLGFGRISLIDPDQIELKNLNRIVNATVADAEASRHKTDRLAEAIRSYRHDAHVASYPTSIDAPDALFAAAHADVLFCCVDSAVGRQICDLIASSFVIPLFDVGVTIPTIETGTSVKIADVVGRVDYIQPGGSSLADRGVYTQQMLRADLLKEIDPGAYKAELSEGYIDGIHEEAPSVISLNMRAASTAVNEFVARTYPYRHGDNRDCARVEFSLADMSEEYWSEDNWSPRLTRHLLGQGGKRPLLGIPALNAEHWRGRP